MYATTELLMSMERDNLPYVGGVLNFLLTLIDLGALGTTAYQMLCWRRKTGQTNDAAL
jgi:hypothetical protein